jgi:microcin C transport system substrate-binding protein
LVDDDTITLVDVPSDDLRLFKTSLDFEEMNKQFFYGAYKRIGSFFEGSELASSGIPTGLEIEILETVRGQVPPEVFTTEYKNPVNGNPEAVRNNLRAATRLLREAGYVMQRPHRYKDRG